MYDFVGKRKWFFLASILVILAGIISLGVSWLNTGLDFRPGITMTLVFEKAADEAGLRAAFGDLGYTDAIIQRSPKDAFLLQGLAANQTATDRLAQELERKYATTVRIADFSSPGNATGNQTQNQTGNETLALMFGKTVPEDTLKGDLVALGYADVTVQPATLDSFLVRIGEPDATESTESATDQTEQARIKEALAGKFGPVDYLDFDAVSQAVTTERVRYTGYAILAGAVAILLYIIWAFRKLASSFRYGVCAIAALAHDVLILLAVFAIFRLEVDSMFIIAVLTVIGYGVNNIIVVFDRIRENTARYRTADLESVVNIGITETLTRSLNTSLTTLFTCGALFAFGGPTIHTFMLALIVGIVASFYSSTFIAGQLLVSWEKGDFGRLFRWLPLRRRAT